MDAVLPVRHRVRRLGRRLGNRPHVRPARLGQQLRQLPEGHEDRHEVRRPERQRREGRGRARPSDWVINAYADTNGNGVRDAGENTISATDTTNATGVYSLSLNPGKYVVCEIQQATWTQSFPSGTACGAAAGGWGITLASGDLDSGNDFGN